MLVFVEGAIPGSGGGRGGSTGSGRGGSGSADRPVDIPAEYQSQLGRVTPDRTLPEIRRFVENGGTVVAIGDSAMNLAAYLKLPVENHLVENGAPLPRTKFYTPGSVLQARVDTAHPIAHGMAERTDVFFENNPVFKLGPAAASQGLKAIGWFDSKTPLRSGWSWGQQYLEGGVAAVGAPAPIQGRDGATGAPRERERGDRRRARI